MLQRLLRLLIAALFAFCLSQHLSAQFLPQYMKQTNQHTVSDGQIKKVLFIGDSMTGWLAERLNAYGAENGFEVSAVIWDGSTIRKWGNAPLEAIIEREKPDAVFMSLGLNELLERNRSAVMRRRSTIYSKPWATASLCGWGHRHGPAREKGKH